MVPHRWHRAKVRVGTIIVGSKSGSQSGSQSARYRVSTVLIAGRRFLNADPTPGESPGTRFDPDSDPDLKPTIRAIPNSRD